MQTKTRRLLKWSVLIILVIVGSGIIYLSQNDFFIAGGSDSLNVSISPPLWAQTISLLILVFSVYASFSVNIKWIQNSLLRAIVVTIGIIVFTLSIHFINIDGKHNRIVEYWGPFNGNSIDYNPVDGPSNNITYTESLFWLEFHNKENNQSMPVFLGITPWRICPNSVLETPIMKDVQKTST
jgi:hypothetical protein